jgi:hypothetical protein
MCNQYNRSKKNVQTKDDSQICDIMYVLKVKRIINNYRKNISMTPLIIVAERKMFERKENRNCIFERFVLLFMKLLNKNDTQHSIS